MNEIKYCVDCRWHCRAPTMLMVDSKCLHPTVKDLSAKQYSAGAERVSPDIQILPRCSAARDDETLCGQDGHYFEMPARRRSLLRKIFK